MKKSIYYLSLALAAILTASCNGDFFDQVPNDVLTVEQIFNSKKYSEEYLAGVYDYVKEEWHRTSDVPWDPCSDDFDQTYDRGNDYPTYKMNLGKWNASSNYYNFWKDYYQGIRSATFFMNNIDGNEEILAEAGQDLIDQYKAEARFLRAFYYFNILRQYGPFIILGDDAIPGDLPSDDPAMNKPRSTYDECVAYIERELDLAANDLPLHFAEQKKTDYGRATKAMCMAVKSRMLLYAASPQFNGNPMYANFRNPDGTQLISQTYDREKWKKAADAAKDIIDLGIFDLYKVRNSDQSINPYLSVRNVYLDNFNCEYIVFRINNWLRYWDQAASPLQTGGYQSMAATQQLVDEFEMANGKGIFEDGSGYVEEGYSGTDYKDSKSGFVYCPAGSRMMYYGREPRFYANICFNGSYWVGDNATRIALYYTGASGRSKTTDNYPRSGYIAIKNIPPETNCKSGIYLTRPAILYRYTEVLLNYIEALNEYDPGNSDIAYYLNLIRERAGLPAVEGGLSQEVMQQKIRHERRVELCFENLRYFDTRRWLIAEQTDGGPFYGMNMMAGNSYKDDAFYARTIFETRVFRNNYYLFPIPQSEVVKNSNLVQNPGW